MANLKSICEQSWLQVYPRGNDEATVTREEFLATGKNMYAYEMLLLYWTERQREGEFLMPSHLLTEVELDVVDNKMDISKLKVFRSLPSDVWVQNIGGLLCECKYVKSSVNMTQLMCDDDSLGEARRYIPVAKSILFPDGVHKTPLTIIYANMGEDIDDSIEVDDALGAIVREKLVALYLGKIGQENKSNDSNANTP